MSKIRIELNREGVRELLRSPEMLAICEEQARAVAARCGGGYEVDSMVGRNRVNAAVSASTKEAIQDNLKNNTVLKAIGG